MQRGELQRTTPLTHTTLGREGQRSMAERKQAALGAMVMPGPRAAPWRPRAKRRHQPAWWTGEIRGTVCVVCEQAPATEGHHILSVQRLRSEAERRGYTFEAVLWDRRNRLGVCPDCHANHHARSRPIPRAVLLRVASWVFAFARELDLEWALDREYPADRMEAVA